MGKLARSLALWTLLLPVSLVPAHAQDAPEPKGLGGRVILVLPFENRSGQPSLDWIGDSFPDTLGERFSTSGFLTITREDRLYALDHLGLPAGFRPTRATTIRIAQTLDADFVVVGNFTVQGPRISVQAQVLRVNELRLSPPLADSSELTRLLDAENAVAWKAAREIDPHFPVAEQTFLSASSTVKLSSFENYVRGTDASNPQDRIKHLQLAVNETPTYSAATLALGKALYTQREYDRAAATLAKIPPTDRRALEAQFFLGLARVNTGRYSEAEAAFAFVAGRLPLPEVVNNQGVARSRQGRDAAALFERAVAADPNDPDFHYNLAVSLLRRNDVAGAQREAAAALKLRPNDTEIQELRDRLASGRLTLASSRADAASPDPNAFAPLERVRRTYSEVSFRQAAFQLAQMRELRLQTLSPAERSAQYVQQGRDFLNQGLLPEAEKEFSSAIASDPSSFAGHAGLAQVREQSADPADARTEAQASLRIRPNVPAYLVLARIELNGNQLGASASDVGNALRLEPSNSAALGMKQALQTRGQTIP